MRRPSRTTVPLSGASSLDIVLSSVDLPHAFAPTITLILPAGTSRSTSSTMTAPAYPATRPSVRSWCAWVMKSLRGGWYG